MITPGRLDDFEMQMFDHGGSRVSLDKVATEAYGRKYCGQQTEGCKAPGWYRYNMLSHHHVEECLVSDEQIAEYSHLRADGYYDDPVGNESGYVTVRHWLASPVPEYDFKDERAAPGPETMLAQLVADGFLPYGRYMIEIDW